MSVVVVVSHRPIIPDPDIVSHGGFFSFDDLFWSHFTTVTKAECRADQYSAQIQHKYIFVICICILSQIEQIINDYFTAWISHLFFLWGILQFLKNSLDGTLDPIHQKMFPPMTAFPSQFRPSIQSWEVLCIGYAHLLRLAKGTCLALLGVGLS